MRTLYLLPAAAIALFAQASPAAARGFERQVAAEARGMVDISNVAGRIEVVGWDRPEVSVKAELEGGVERVDVTSDRGRTGITVVLPGGLRGGGSAILRVQVPWGSELNVSGVSADVASSALQGVQRIKTVSGDITAEIAPAGGEIKTVSGNVVLTGSGPGGDLRVTTISGDVHLQHGSGDVETSTVSGLVTLQMDTGRNLRLHTTSGDLTVLGKLQGGSDVDAQTVSGDVTLRAALDSGLEYEVQTFSGSITNCFNAEVARTSRYAPGYRLNGTRGNGSVHIRIKTMSGDVQLCDKADR